VHYGPHALPQIDERVFLTDGGLETTLVFHYGLDLPCFAAFPLLRDANGRASLRRYIEPYLAAAAERDLGFILDTPTWRANADWAAKLGYSPEDVSAINREAVAWAMAIRDEFGGDRSRILIEGAIGPRGDGYRVETRMSADEAVAYHMPQIEAFRDAGADMVAAVTMNYPEEGIGAAMAAKHARIPSVISFTVETDGRLASGDALRAAIERVEDETDGAPLYYMINCAHPSHFDAIFAEGGAWIDRIRGLRANASAKSHAELDESTELDAGDPADLGARYARLRAPLRRLSVFGGCCGTDHRHVRAICDACLPAARAA
jgi:homocysteine S-methyltransferase